MSNRRRENRGRRFTLRVAVLCIAFTAVTSRARAQQSRPSTPLDSLKPGARVRAISNVGRDTLEAFARDVRADTLFVSRCRKCDTAMVAIPLRPAFDLQAERRRIAPGTVASDMVAGLIFGSLVGAGVGGLVAYHEYHSPGCRDLCGFALLYVPFLGAIGGGTGVVTGGILGATVHRESYWVRITLPASVR